MRSPAQSSKSTSNAVDQYIEANLKDPNFRTHGFKGDFGMQARAAQDAIRKWDAQKLIALKNGDAKAIQDMQELFKKIQTDIDERLSKLTEEQLSQIPNEKRDSFARHLTEGYIFYTLVKIFPEINKKYKADKENPNLAADFQNAALAASKVYLDNIAQRKNSPRIDPGFFEDFKIKDISVLTDPNAVKLRTQIGVVATDVEFTPQWEFIQLVQKFNSEGYTPKDLQNLIQTYIANNDINISDARKKQIMAEAEMPNAGLFIFKDAIKDIFHTNFRNNTSLLNDSKFKAELDTLVEKTMTLQKIADAMRGIKTNKDLENAPMKEWEKLITSTLTKIDSRIEFTNKQIQNFENQLSAMPPGVENSHINAELIRLKGDIKVLNQQKARFEPIKVQVEKHQEMFVNYQKQKDDLLKKQNAEIQHVFHEFHPSKINISQVTSSFTKDLKDYADSHSRKNDTLNIEKTSIAIAANLEIAKLRRAFEPGTTDQQKFEALVAFQIAINMLITRNQKAVDVHNKTASIFSKASYGDLNKILSGIVDEKSKLGMVLAAAKATHDIFVVPQQQKIAELQRKPPQIPKAVESPVVTVEQTRKMTR